MKKEEQILYAIMIIAFIGLFISICIDYMTGAIGWGLMLLAFSNHRPEENEDEGK